MVSEGGEEDSNKDVPSHLGSEPPVHTTTTPTDVAISLHILLGNTTIQTLKLGDVIRQH